jgi:DGQHR domain-containing protein
MNANDVHFLAKSQKRSEKEGVQRDESPKRIKEISSYCSDPDATFPTPIILAIDSCNIENIDSYLDDKKIILKSEKHSLSILDGQHRIEGIGASGLGERFELPIVLVIDVTEEEKAYIFSIINSKQTKVPPSLIYDLFSVSTRRSPQKTCHEIARSLNSDEKSPFYGRLKMLGKGGGSYASISQGTFVKALLELITKKPDEYLINIKNQDGLAPEELPFNKYFRDEKDEVIRKIIFNLFSAVKNTFENEWETPDNFILSKAIGYGAILKAFPYIHARCLHEKSFEESTFEKIFEIFKNDLDGQGLTLTSENFSSNQQNVNKLAKLIRDSVDKL